MSQQLDAIFVALKLQLQNRRCKAGAICRRDIAGVSNMFEAFKGGFPLSRNFYVRTDVNFNWLLRA